MAKKALFIQPGKLGDLVVTTPIANIIMIWVMRCIGQFSIILKIILMHSTI